MHGSLFQCQFLFSRHTYLDDAQVYVELDGDVSAGRAAAALLRDHFLRELERAVHFEPGRLAEDPLVAGQVLPQAGDAGEVAVVGTDLGEAALAPTLRQRLIKI